MSNIEKPDTTGAHRRAETIRDGMRGWAAAQEAIVEAYEQRDWITLGHKSWDEYIEKEYGERRLKLTKAQRVEAVEAFQLLGMSQRQMAHALGVSRNTIAGDLAPEVAQTEPPSEAGPSQTAAGESPPDGGPADSAEDVHDPSDDAPAPAGVTPNPEEASCTTADQDSPVAVSDNETAALVAAEQQPGSDSLTGQDSETEGVETAPEGLAVATAGQSGMSHPSATGEAPTGYGPSDAGVRPHVLVGENEARDETAGVPEVPGPSAVDPIKVFRLRGVVRRFGEELDQIDIDEVGPQLTDEDLEHLDAAVDRFAQFVELLRLWRDRT